MLGHIRAAVFRGPPCREVYSLPHFPLGLHPSVKGKLGKPSFFCPCRACFFLSMPSMAAISVPAPTKTGNRRRAHVVFGRMCVHVSGLHHHIKAVFCDAALVANQPWFSQCCGRYGCERGYLNLFFELLT